MESTLVMKFGGTSVTDADALRRVCGIVARARGAGARPVVVTSAMSGVTDRLLLAVRSAREGRTAAAEAEIDLLGSRHREASATLLDGAAHAAYDTVLGETAEQIGSLLRVIRDHPGTRSALEDEVVSQGERLSSRLLAGALAGAGTPARWVDARACVKTDAVHTRATPLAEPTRRCTREALEPIVEAGEVPVLGGFIGSTPEGATTTLGRGGSDFTGALVGAALESDEIQIWTDVNGFLTADPRVVAGARTIAHLSYAEAAELAYFGAKVLHPRTIQPAVELGLPVRICNSREMDAAGTIVDGRREASPRGIKAIAHKRGVTVVRVTSARMLGAYGFLRAIFEVFDRHRTPVDIVATSEVSVSLTVEGADDLSAILTELEALGDVEQQPEHAIVCVVGEGLRTTPGVAGRVFGALGDVNIVLISQGASSTNLTFVVTGAEVERAVVRLHSEFFGV